VLVLSSFDDAEKIDERPKQLPAVDRNATKRASVPVGANVGPSAWWNDVLDAAPGIIGSLGSVF
jgi:hypothetical protein